MTILIWPWLVRIEIESKLKEIADARGISILQKGIRPLIRQLENKSVLNNREVAALEDILPLLNEATHGAEIDSRATSWAMDIGPRLLATLDEKIGERTIPQLVKQWKKSDGALVAETGAKLSKALIVSPKAFLSAMHEDEESFTRWLDKLQHHSFTLFESTNEVEDDLYSAYYEKLRELILKAVRPFFCSEYGVEAKKVHDAVISVEIKRIW